MDISLFFPGNAGKKKSIRRHWILLDIDSEEDVEYEKDHKDNKEDEENKDEHENNDIFEDDRGRGW